MTALQSRRGRAGAVQDIAPRRRRRPIWHLLALGAVAVAAVVLAVLELGSPSSSARTVRETLTAQRGVVQSTVTGSGNLAAGVDDEVAFQTSGTLEHLYVEVGDHVRRGQLLATLDQASAREQVAEAQDELTSAKDQLTSAEEAQAGGSSSSSSGASDELPDTPTTEFAAYTPPVGSSTSTTSTTTSSTTPATSTTPTTPTTPSSTTPTRTTTSPTTPTRTTTTPTKSPTRTTPASTSTTGIQTTTSPARTATPSAGGSLRSGASTGSDSGTTGSDESSTTNAATLASNVASAKASVRSSKASLASAKTALRQTRLYAPSSGTVASVADVSPGDAISGGSSSSSSSDTSSEASSAGGTGSTTTGSLDGSSSTSSSSSSSSGLVQIVNTHTMTMTVAFDESDIDKIHVGQAATVTPEALSGVELGARVTAVSNVGTESSDVVSYDATLTLDQRSSKVRAGMSASAAVIASQASGVTLPTSAVTSTGNTATVNVLRNGKTVPTQVIVGLRGDSRVQIVSGLKAGEEVVVAETLPSLGSTSSSSSSSSSSGASSGLGSRFGGTGAFGGGGTFGGGGFSGGPPAGFGGG